MSRIPRLLSWRQRYRIGQFLEQSIWVVPTLGMIAALIVAALLRRLDAALGWQSAIDPAVAQAALSALASSMFTFVVFVSSALLLALQLASAQLTPRIVGFMFADRVVKGALAVFVFSFTYMVTVLANLRSSVPALTANVAAYLAILNLACFLYMVGHVGLSLRANGALRAVGVVGRRVVGAVYPSPVRASPATAEMALPGAPVAEVPCDRYGVILGFDTAGLIALACRNDCIIEIVPQVGSFVARGDPLFRLYRGGTGIPHVTLRRAIAVGRERTFYQDPAFAFRIIVDISTRALSPAINDPTTAVMGLDEIHHLLAEVGRRHLDDHVFDDASGRPRVACQTPGWEDFVSLAITEIRMYGSDSIQVSRRLRALLEDLIRRLPDHRAPPLRRELALLRRSGERSFTDPEDRALAEASDLLGVGGRSPAEPSGNSQVESAGGARP